MWKYVFSHRYFGIYQVCKKNKTETKHSDTICKIIVV